MRVAAAVRLVTEALDELFDARLLALLAAAVERPLGALPLEDLQVRFDRRAAVVRELGVEMEVEDHAGRNFGSVASAVTSSNTTVTGMPTRTASPAQPTRFVTSLGPSSSSTMASTYGTSSRNPGV